MSDLIEEIAFLERENARLQKQVTELQERMTEMVNAQLSRRVRAFMLATEQPVAWTPKVPDEKLLRFRLNLVAEEFFEMLDACAVEFGCGPEEASRNAHLIVYEGIKDARDIDVDLPKLVDALADLDYVIEGFRATLGVNGDPIVDAVHASNMAKLSPCPTCNGASAIPFLQARLPECPDCRNTGRVVVKRPEDGKVVKPEGWKPPDVEGELRKQGWEP